MGAQGGVSGGPWGCLSGPYAVIGELMKTLKICWFLLCFECLEVLGEALGVPGDALGSPWRSLGSPWGVLGGTLVIPNGEKWPW